MLKPGGRVWISEMCATGLVYLGQRLACPLSRVALHLLGSPLIIMHPHDFYVEVLCRVGFVDPAVEPRSAPDARPTDWVRPIIALPSLAIPRWLFPFQPTLIHARRA